ncbi:YrbL family protein [Olleya sp. HaHaR_3_96]|uniref:YrbL family protein n=1 Tax=Olleya sp. HaHaR_3_96 TaxID=2745560 RepID=UPI001C4F4BAA|nr:YrbL family protein [Olleya sp. HaHaR_3_96]QXP59475.1 hypothetical protein H0I26_16390 [Olleya sp. HaHaR_3_96]
MIKIGEKDYIGQGTFQKCYIHPDNNNFCLKIRKNVHSNKFRIDQEIQYYKKIQKRNTTIPYISKYYGEENTNYGVASVYDLIKDETTNSVSLSMYDYLIMDKSPFSDDLFVSELDKLKKKLIKNKIIIRDLTAKNICCKILANKSIELIIIDGVGHRDFIPFVEWIRFFTKRKINKIYKKKKLHSMDEHRAWLASQNIY